MLVVLVVVVVVLVLRPVNEASYIRANPTSVSVPSGQRVIRTAKAPGYKTCHHFAKSADGRFTQVN